LREVTVLLGQVAVEQLSEAASVKSIDVLKVNAIVVTRLQRVEEIL